MEEVWPDRRFNGPACCLGCLPLGLAAHHFLHLALFGTAGVIADHSVGRSAVAIQDASDAEAGLPGEPVAAAKDFAGAAGEEHGIAAVLKGMPDYVDQVVVVDNNSTDETGRIAQELGARVVAVAERGSPFTIAISPKNSPGGNTAITLSSRPSRRVSLTRPD